MTPNPDFPDELPPRGASLPTSRLRRAVSVVEPLWLLLRANAAVQTPWIAVIAIFAAFVDSDQGLSVRDIPVSHPWMQSAVYAGVTWGIIVPSIFLSSRANLFTSLSRHTSAKKVLLAWALMPYVVALVVASLLSIIVATTKVYWSYHLLNTLAGVSSAVLFLWSGKWRQRNQKRDKLSKVLVDRTHVWIVLFASISIQILGYLLLTQAMGWLILLGPGCVAFVGLACLASTVQLCLVALPVTLGSPLWAFIFIVVAATFVLWQSPMPERPNPLLMDVPMVAEASADTECGSQINKARAAGVMSTPHTVINPGTSEGHNTFLVSAEGGGIRAAYWTAVFLEELSTVRARPLPADVRLLSGVSGGSLGLATWVAAQRLPAPARLTCIKSFLSRDFLTPLVAGLFFLDAPRLFVSSDLWDKHRGDYFERYIAEEWWKLTGDRLFYENLASLRLPRRDARIYFNATDAISGQFMAFGNAAPPPAPGASEKSNRLNLLIVDKLKKVTVAQAVHFSARFLYLSPTPDVMLPTSDVAKAILGRADVSDPRLARAATLVDGGYFDNSGLGPVLRALEDEAASSSGSGATEKTIALHILNAQERTCEEMPDNPGCMNLATQRLSSLGTKDNWGWLTRPLTAIVLVRESHSLQRLNELRLSLGLGERIVAARCADAGRKAANEEWLSRCRPLLAGARSEPPPIETIAMAFPSESIAERPWWCRDWVCGKDRRGRGVALGWMLAPNETKLMDQQALIRAREVAARYP